MSTDSTRRRPSTDMDRIGATFTIKKQKKSTTKKKKKSFPVNPVRLEESVTSISPSKSARKSSKSSKSNKTKKKSIIKASSLIRHSPRFSNRTRMSQPISPSKRKRKKANARTNSSSVYKFIDYEAYVNDTDDNKTESDSDNNDNINSTPAPIPTHSRESKKKATKRSHSVSRNRERLVSDDDMNMDENNINDNALLKRLKSENKELRKSRNCLRKDHSLLTKIESKLRHKLNMILIKFKQIKLDFIDDQTDCIKLQKKGDIEGVLDAVFVKFSQITDQFVRQQRKWREQHKKINKLKNGWTQFVQKHIEHDDDNQFGFESMFEILNKEFTQSQVERKRLFDLVAMYQKKEKKQQTDIHKLQQENNELQQYKQKHFDAQQQINEQQQQFENEKIKYTKQSAANQEKLAQFQQQTDNLQQQLAQKTDDLSSLLTYIRTLEAENEEFVETINKYKRENGELTQELCSLNAENAKLTKGKQEFESLKKDHMSVTQTLSEVQAEIDGLQDEFRIIYKGKKRMESENAALTTRVHDLEHKLSAVEVENNALHSKINVAKREYGTQTHFGYILENEHVRALESENEYLMKELDFLIAERSRFKPCVSDTDYHCGDVKSMVVSPINYNVITGGKQDNSLRIWQPKESMNGENEITFVPIQKALIDGMILTVSMSADGVLLGVGASLKNTVNGYVIIYNMKDNGNVLCNLRSRTLLRFGKVHCVKFMEFEGEKQDKNEKNVTRRYKKKGNKQKKKKKNKNGMNYLVFCGDTTGMILCWNLSSEFMSFPVCVINGHSDIVYDLCIVDNKWLFSVSHDQCLMYVDIAEFDTKFKEVNNDKSVDYVFSTKLFMDDSKYPLKSIEFNRKSNELIFGSRKCSMFKMNNDDDDEKKDTGKNNKYFVAKCGLNTKDLDHICNLKKSANLMVVQRTGINYVKVFNLNTNKVVKTYQIDDGKNDNNKFKIYDCGISYDQKYAILCVGIFNKENLSNLELNRSALKGFKIPKSSKK